MVWLILGFIATFIVGMVVGALGAAALLNNLICGVFRW